MSAPAKYGGPVDVTGFYNAGVIHVFGGWEQFPFYNAARSGNWCDFGFLLGAGSPLLGALGGRARRGQ